jgi:hypothetical protein
VAYKLKICIMYNEEIIYVDIDTSDSCILVHAFKFRIWSILAVL